MASGLLMPSVAWGDGEPSSDDEAESCHRGSLGPRSAYSPGERLAYDSFEARAPESSDDGSDPRDNLSELNSYEIHRLDNPASHRGSLDPRRAYSPGERLAYDSCEARAPESSDDGFDPSDIPSEVNSYEIHLLDNPGSHRGSLGPRRAYSPGERLAYDIFGERAPESSDDGFDPNDVLSELNSYAIHRLDNPGSSRPQSFHRGRLNMLQRNRVAQRNVVRDDWDEEFLYARRVARPHDMLRSLWRRSFDGSRMVEQVASWNSEFDIGYLCSSASTRCPSVTSSSDCFSDELDSHLNSPAPVLSCDRQAMVEDAS